MSPGYDTENVHGDSLDASGRANCSRALPRLNFNNYIGLDSDHSSTSWTSAASLWGFWLRWQGSAAGEIRVGPDADRYFGNNSPCRRGRVHREDGRPTIDKA